QREMGHLGGIAGISLCCGLVRISQDNLAEAIAHFEESLRLYRELGDRHSIAWSLGCLGEALLRRGERRAARSLMEECRAVASDLGAGERLAQAHLYLSGLEIEEDNGPQARAHAHIACELLQRSRNWQFAGWCLVSAARVALIEKKPERAARLLAANEAYH